MQTDKIIEFVNQTYLLLNAELTTNQNLLYICIFASFCSVYISIGISNKFKKLTQQLEQQGKNNTSININQK